MAPRKTKKMHYYDFSRVMSYNAVYMFIVGARGLGKTYGAKKLAIKKAIHNREQFIYLRRYASELEYFHTFFADIQHEFPNWDFRVEGGKAYMAHVDTRDKKPRPWILIGYAIPLSSSQQFKSVAFPEVTSIIFDEFVLDKGVTQYLPSEARKFNDFYSTVDRNKDKTRVYFLANALSITNPYFIEYQILPNRDGSDEIILRKNGFIVAHFPDSKKFSEDVYNTRFGQFIQDTEYADYSVGNKFSDNHDNLIAPKPSNAAYYCTVETNIGAFSVWIDFRTNDFFLQEKRPGNENIYVVEMQQMAEGKVLLTKSHNLTGSMSRAFRRGKMYFDTPRTRNAFIEVFRQR